MQNKLFGIFDEHSWLGYPGIAVVDKDFWDKTHTLDPDNDPLHYGCAYATRDAIYAKCYGLVSLPISYVNDRDMIKKVVTVDNIKTVMERDGYIFSQELSDLMQQAHNKAIEFLKQEDPDKG